MTHVNGSAMPLVCPRKGRGRLDVIVGPMFAQKTTMLLSRLTLLASLGHRVLYINHAFDKARADGSWYSSHNKAARYIGNFITGANDAPPSPEDGPRVNTKQQQQQLIPDATMTDLLYNVADLCSAYDVIGIDEGQFFTDIVSFCRELSPTKQLIVTGLDGNFRMEPFGHIAELLPMSDSFVKVGAVCKVCMEAGQVDGVCGSGGVGGVVAPFTQKRRVLPSGIDCSSGPVDIGGAEKYEAVCRVHHSSSVPPAPVEPVPVRRRGVRTNVPRVHMKSTRTWQKEILAKRRRTPCQQ